MRYLILADIHSNLEALEACLRDAAARHYDRVLVLGDVVGQPGCRALFVGPSDLAADWGHLGEPRHPEVQAAIADACARCARLGKPLGTFAPIADEARRYLEMGVRFAAVGADAVVLRRGMDALREIFRRL